MFGGNADADEVSALAAANGLPTGAAEFTFTPVIVNTGAELILFDTDNGEGRRPGRGFSRAQLGAAMRLRISTSL